MPACRRGRCSPPATRLAARPVRPAAAAPIPACRRGQCSPPATRLAASSVRPAGAAPIPACRRGQCSPPATRLAASPVRPAGAAPMPACRRGRPARPAARIAACSDPLPASAPMPRRCDALRSMHHAAHAMPAIRHRSRCSSGRVRRVAPATRRFPHAPAPACRQVRPAPPMQARAEYPGRSATQRDPRTGPVPQPPRPPATVRPMHQSPRPDRRHDGATAATGSGRIRQPRAGRDAGPAATLRRFRRSRYASRAAVRRSGSACAACPRYRAVHRPDSVPTAGCRSRAAIRRAPAAMPRLRPAHASPAPPAPRCPARPSPVATAARTGTGADP